MLVQDQKCEQRLIGLILRRRLEPWHSGMDLTIDGNYLCVNMLGHLVAKLFTLVVLYFDQTHPSNLL